MDAATNQVDTRFTLAGASKYRDRPGAGCFGGVPDVVSLHTFGWNRIQQCLYVEDDFGIGGDGMHRVFMPVELAEQFLMSCLYEDFRQDFLIDVYGIKEPLEEIFRADGYTLKVSRDVAKPIINSSRYWLPGLSIACLDPKGDTRSLALFSALRNSLGRRMATLTVPELRKGLDSE